MMSRVPDAPQDTTPPRRDPAHISQVRRLQAKVDRAKVALEAATLTRDMEMMAAMDNGWTSADIADALGISPESVRQMVYKRRTGRPGTKRRREKGDT
jgi:DNA-directed RNA polymerase specialized sigma24 family protein